MQVEFFGANCLRIKVNNTVLVFDDNLESLGGKSITSANDVVCLTNAQLIPQPRTARIIFDTPGNYEISDILIDAVRVDSYNGGDYPYSTIYKIMCEDINLVIVGHIKPNLNDEQLEELGLVDVLFVPVGGNGYTLDAVAALKVTRSIDPKLVIPTHYEQKGLKFEVPQQSYEEFVKIIASETETIQGSLKLKKNDLGEQLAVKILQNI